MRVAHTAYRVAPGYRTATLVPFRESHLTCVAVSHSRSDKRIFVNVAVSD